MPGFGSASFCENNPVRRLYPLIQTLPQRIVRKDNVPNRRDNVHNGRDNVHVVKMFVYPPPLKKNEVVLTATCGAVTDVEHKRRSRRRAGMLPRHPNEITRNHDTLVTQKKEENKSVHTVVGGCCTQMANTNPVHGMVLRRCPNTKMKRPDSTIHQRQ